MSPMQTTCPSCHAVFRVSPQQLEAHAGKVRCGKCAYVFNGFETLITPIETVSFMAPYEEDIEEEFEAEDAAEQAEENAIEAPAESASRETVTVYDARPVTISGSFPLQTDEQIAREAEEINRVIAATSHPDLIDEAARLEQRQNKQASKSSIKITPELHAKLNNLQQQLTQQEQHARWHVLGWGLGVAVLLLLLAGQSGYYFRNTIAAYYPETKPLLVNLCRPLGCKVAMLANIGQIKLDGVELQALPERPNIVTFSATMRNNAAYRQAYPHLELTLTDISNQTLARRHFVPNEYLPSNLKAESGLPIQDEVPIKLSLDLEQLGAVGYKSRVFYP